MQNDRQCPFRQDFLFRNVHRNRERILDHGTMITTRTKTVFSPDHHEADPLVEDGVVNCLQLNDIERVRRNIDKYNRIIRHQ